MRGVMVGRVQPASEVLVGSTRPTTSEALQ